MPRDDHPRTEYPDRADEADLAARLRVSTTRLARRLRQESGVELTPSMVSALTMIAARGPLTLGELAELERVAPPTVTKVVNKLADAALVLREPDRSDRRVCRVRTTDAGEQLLAASRERRTAWLAARLGELDDEDLAALARASDAMDRLLAQDDGWSPS